MNLMLKRRYLREPRSTILPPSYQGRRTVNNGPQNNHGSAPVFIPKIAPLERIGGHLDESEISKISFWRCYTEKDHRKIAPRVGIMLLGRCLQKTKLDTRTKLDIIFIKTQCLRLKKSTQKLCRLLWNRVLFIITTRGNCYITLLFAVFTITTNDLQ